MVQRARATPTLSWSILAALSAPLKKNPSTPSSKWPTQRRRDKLKNSSSPDASPSAIRTNSPAELPEVDLFIGTGEVPRIAEILREHEAQHQARRQYIGVPSYIYDHATPRLRSTPSYTAFLKVSEGCDHKCAFCIIPQLRGPHRSRSIDSVVARSDDAGAKRRQRDQSHRSGSHRLRPRPKRRHHALRTFARKWIKYPEIEWIRLLYAYPNFLDKPLLELIRDSDKICKYIDIPFQHISQSSCSECAGAKAAAPFEKRLSKLREAIPDLTLRTSLIVGFPGETEADFEELLEFVEEAQFERLGRI